ncbi:hypothetical protein B0A50_08790 [Salinomyces thailandicus]|uniref:Uncharacterized protein n=1 Tax=Salinomyces thailandicus TaxID=706561 RepID=A0A4U0TIS7_9PEZI|nr:hypothetical protein B0A50_08790 [Salinomyces thailandica]
MSDGSISSSGDLLEFFRHHDRCRHWQISFTLQNLRDVRHRLSLDAEIERVGDSLLELHAMIKSNLYLKSRGAALRRTDDGVDHMPPKEGILILVEKERARRRIWTAARSTTAE